MDFIENIKQKIKTNKKTIILPESLDERVLKAAEKVANEDLVKILLLGKKEHILKKAEQLSLVFHSNNIEIIDYLSKENKETFENYAKKLCEIRKNKGLEFSEAKKILENEIYYAMMMLEDEKADGLVAGSVFSTKNILKPALQIIKTKKESKLVSSYFLIDTKIKEFGEEGVLLFADCGLNIDPTAEELASIAEDSAKTFENIFNEEARVALLSFSSFGSAESESVEKVRKALNILKEKNEKILVDGEMQLDTALIKDVANKKAPNSKVAGRANVLVFPDLDSGNIGYKMAQYMSRGKAYGPLLQGIKKPVNDLSRGTTAEEIYGAILITVMQSEENKTKEN